jgi:hypothetical protein
MFLMMGKMWGYFGGSTTKISPHNLSATGDSQRLK